MYFRYYTIDWDKNLNHSCTSGWLLSEVIRHLCSEYKSQCLYKHYTFENIIAIKMLNGIESLDFWLTQFERPLTPLKTDDMLHVIYSGSLLNSNSKLQISLSWS